MDQILALFADPAVWAALISLIVMEVVLGIDNLIFISILTNKLPEEHRARARMLGIGGALIMRILLLFTIAWIVALKEPVITLFDKGFSWRDIILIAGGLFLVYKATKEINHATETHVKDGELETHEKPKLVTTSVAAAIAQILLLDLVFSIDSILTAVGMTEHVPIMVIAVLFAVFVMFVASTPIANFIAKHPSIVMLALGFLLMIGMVLIAEGFGAHIEKGYIYAAMGFSAFVEFLQMFRRKKSGTAH